MIKILTLAATLAIATLLAQDQPDANGKYHDPITGVEQPAICNTAPENPHPCDCNRAKSCDPDVQKAHPSRECSTFCRSNACRCISPCNSMHH